MIVSLILCYYLLSIAYGDCQWAVKAATGGTVTLDLSCIEEEHKTIHIKGTGQDSHHDYYWSMCSNSQQCNGDNVMVRQIVDGDSSHCYVLGRYDGKIKPTTPNGDTWQFVYANGQNDCGHPARTWAPTFICNPDEEWKVGNVNEELNTCYYTIIINTKYACSNNVMHCAPKEEYNFPYGWVFLSGLIGLLFVYCLIGYCIMGICVNKDGGITDCPNNIPQKSFWWGFPKFVLAGCIYSKDFVCGLCIKSDSGGGDTTDREESLLDD